MEKKLQRLNGSLLLSHARNISCLHLRKHTKYYFLIIFVFLKINGATSILVNNLEKFKLNVFIEIFAYVRGLRPPNFLKSCTILVILVTLSKNYSAMSRLCRWLAQTVKKNLLQCEYPQQYLNIP